MKKTRILCLFLVLSMCLGMLLACNDDTPGTEGGGDRVEGSWDGVDFGGQKVRLCVSAHQTPECNFPAADIYTKGPDKAGSNEVSKAVLARNKQAQDDLGITIEYDTRNLYYDAVIEDVRTIVQTASKNSPDIYNNDCCSLTYSMVSGFLWNTKNPGEDVKNYFDYSAKGWYTEFIRGCTFDQEKLYMFAGDYFIDMIRMAWVIYVNNDILSANLGKLPGWCKSVDAFYEYVLDGFWDMDMLADFSSRVFVDGAGGTLGLTEREDALVGFAYVNNSNWAFSAASGITLYYQDKENNYKPMVLQDISDYQKVADKFANLTSTKGVYNASTNVTGVNNIKQSTECFLENNFLFAMSRLGEMESQALRDFGSAKGIVPVPKWNADEQDEYLTILHDQVEVGSILKTAKSFSASSALMQNLNEESEEVVYTYYEKGLKYKYNDDKNARRVMDLIRETTTSPFGFQIGDHCQNLYEGTPALKGLYISNSATISSTFASEKDAYNDCMRQMIEKFAKMD